MVASTPRSLIAAFALGVTLLSAGAEATPQQDAEAATLSAKLMSPFCPGRTLAACPSPRAAAWREEIRGWVEAGEDEATIVTRLQARLPPEVRLSSSPPGAWGWLIPSLSTLLISLIITGLYRRSKRARPEPAGAPVPAFAGPGLAAAEAALRRELEDLD